MRTIAFLLLLIAGFFVKQTYAYTNISVNDPRNGGLWAKGVISNASITITPQGDYFYYDLELELGVGVTNRTDSYDSLEIVCDFDLPAGAFIESASLLIGNDWVNAELMPRKEAHAIYEGLVKRRIDPLIIYKNSGDNYKFKIFPISTSYKRVMRLRYAIASSVIAGNKTAAIPYELFKASENPVDLKLFVQKSDDFKNPYIGDEKFVESTTKPGYYEAVVSGADSKEIFSENTKQAYSFMSSKNEADISYKFSFIPDQLFDLDDSKKYLFIIDINPNVFIDSTYSRSWNSVLGEYENYNLKRVVKVIPIELQEVLGQVKEVLTNLSDDDKFNIILKNNDVFVLSEDWLSINDANIELANEKVLLESKSYSGSMKTLLNKASQFINQENVVPLLLSNNQEAGYNNWNVTDIVNSTLENLSLNKKVKVYDFSSYKYETLYGYSYYYTSNYFLSRLANNLSAGSYGYKTQISKNNTLQQYFENDKLEYLSKIMLLNVSSTSNTGIVYDKVVPELLPTLPRKEYVELAKVTAGETLIVDISFIYKGEHYFKKLELSINQEKNEILDDAWAVKVVDALNYSREEEAIALAEKISEENAVLTRNTSFLALEPNIVVEPCYDCPDWNMQFPVWQFDMPILMSNDIMFAEAVPTMDLGMSVMNVSENITTINNDLSVVTEVTADFDDGYDKGVEDAQEDCAISAEEAYSLGYEEGYIKAQEYSTNFEAHTKQKELYVYPTTVTNELQVEFGDVAQLEVSIYDVLGNLVETIILEKGEIINEINSSIATYKPGMYVVKAMVDGELRKAIIIKE